MNLLSLPTLRGSVLRSVCFQIGVAFLLGFVAQGQLNLLQVHQGESSGVELGNSVSNAGDVNGDGVGDIIIGGLGGGGNGARVYSGLDGVLLHSFFHGAPDDFGASASGAGDVNGDGYADLIIGAPLASVSGCPASSGTASIYSGLDGSLIRTISGDSVNERFGWSVAGVGDLNGDGFCDVIIGAYHDSFVGADAGSATVISGIDGSTICTFYGSAAFDRFGISVSGAGDVNADGVPDLIVGADHDGAMGNEPGSARVFSGYDGSLLFQFSGTSNGDFFGFSVSGAGDVNCDGHDDVIIGAFADDTTSPPFNTPNAGSARVYSGLDGTVLYQFLSTKADSEFGFSVSAAGDLNGDGFSDVLVGAPTDGPSPMSWQGSVQGFSGKDGSTLFQILGASNTASRFGHSVSGGVDFNSDGFADVVIGAPHDGSNGSNAGSTHLYTSLTLPVLHYEASNLSPGRLKVEWLPDSALPSSLTGTICCAGATAGGLGIFGVSLAPAELTIFGLPLLIAIDQKNLISTGEFGFDFTGKFTSSTISRQSTFLAGSQLYLQFFESSPLPSSSNGLRMTIVP